MVQSNFNTVREHYHIGKYNVDFRKVDLGYTLQRIFFYWTKKKKSSDNISKLAKEYFMFMQNYYFLLSFVLREQKLSVFLCLVG
jgi:hypothetical protein